MVEHHPINRPAHRRAGSGEPSFPIDRDRAQRARQAAEALFAPKPKPRLDETAESPARAAVEKRAPTALPASPASSRPAAATAAKNAPQRGRHIPSAHAARIRTWLRYGMSIAQVAAVYGVQIAEIERILRQV